MANKLKELKIEVSSSEENRFIAYVERNKFKSHRQALVHLLGVAEGKGDAVGEEEKFEEDLFTPENGKGEVKEEETSKKPAKGGKGKKVAEELAVAMEEETKNDAKATTNGATDSKKGKGRNKGKKGADVSPDPMEEEINEETNGAANADTAKEATKEEEVKKGKGGRKPKKGAEDAAVAAMEEEPKSEQNGALQSGNEETEPPKQTKKAVAAKKSAPRGKGKQQEKETAESNGKADATFVLPSGDAQEVGGKTAASEPASKKGRRGKKAAAEPIAEDAGEGADGDNEPPTAAKPKRGRAAKVNKKYTEDESE